MRAKGMMVLTNQTKEARPGVTIGGIGDEEHKLHVSGHNEDDTPGVQAEDQDSDNIPEHRAIDIKINDKFTKADADKYVQDLVSNPANRARLLYVIFYGTIWSASRGWAAREYTGKNKHYDHVHVSGEADADDNETPWNLPRLTGSAPAPSPDKLAEDGELGPKTIAKWQKVMGTKVDGVITPGNSNLVRAVQRKLKETVDHRLVVDGDGIYQNGKRYKTIGALQRYLGSPVDLVMSVPKSLVVKALQRRLNEDRF